MNYDRLLDRYNQLQQQTNSNAYKTIQDLANKAIIIPKHHFGSNLWEEYIQPGDEVTMCGLVSSICVISNALTIKQIENVEVNVIKDCCAGLTNEDHEAAMTVMKCCQCNII